MNIFPAWMYADPAEVAERIENGEKKAQLRVHHADLSGFDTVAKPRRSFGLVGAETVRMIKQARIRELVARVMKGRL
jgi:hypothetical protein